MQITMLKEDLAYYEKAVRKTFSVNGKEVIVSTWVRNDYEINNYESDYNIVEGKEDLTEEELDELTDELFT